MAQEYTMIKRLWSICGVVLAIFALSSSAQKQKYNVGFENSAYSVGDNYDEATQGADWDVLWSRNMENGEAVISTNAKAGGQRSLQVRYAADVTNPKQGLWALAGAKTYYLRYKLLFADNFVFNGQGGNDGGKLPGLAGSSTSSKYTVCGGGDDCLSGSGFSARLMWRTDGIGELYLYDVTKKSEGNPFGKSVVFSGNKKFKRGAWQTVTQRVTVNDSGASNGIIQVWLDGQKVVDVSGRKIVGAGEDVDALFFSTFFGGGDRSWTPSSPLSAFFDDFVVSQSASDVGL